MSGIVFLGTNALEEIVEFYRSRMGMVLWIEQEECTILRHDNLILGFCQREDADTGGVITFWHGTNKEVDEEYERLKDIAEGPPKVNERYNIYHFYLPDPEGRKVEVQRFLDM
jgi:catechol 2,3-dioxygenase-like lactoylglutathione lyase family enzyme